MAKIKQKNKKTKTSDNIVTIVRVSTAMENSAKQRVIATQGRLLIPAKKQAA